jgi:hypothetical protein
MNTLSISTFRASIFAAILAVAPFSPALNAQNASAVGQMNVPFAFEAGSQHYPAGTYTIRMEDEQLVRIWGTSVAGLSMATVEDSKTPAKNGAAVFQRYGDQYFLNEISITGRTGHVCLRPSKQETQAETAAGKIASTGVEIAFSTAR